MRSNSWMLSIVFIFLSCSVFSSIHYLSGDGDSIFTSTRAGQNLYYHHNTDDLHFYGADRWAVFFMVNCVINDCLHSGYNHCMQAHDHSSVGCTTPPSNFHSVADTFLINAVNIYMPQAVQGSIWLQDNVAAQPGTIRFHATGNFVAGWNEIALSGTSGWTYYVSSPTPLRVENIWMVVEVATSENSPDVSASVGGGLTSYYFDVHSGSNGNYRCMNNNGFDADLIFNLVGRFIDEKMMIEIIAQTPDRFVDINSDYTPHITLRNNSSIPASNVYLKMSLENGNISLSDSVIVAQSLGVNEQVTTVGLDGIPINAYGQYLVQIEVGCETTINQIKQSKIYAIDVFELPREKPLLEAFLSDETKVPTSTIPNTDVIYYFHNSIAANYTWDAYQRSLFYYPVGNINTYINGDLNTKSFTGKFWDNLAEAQNDQTYITIESLDAHVDSLLLLVDVKNAFSIPDSIIQNYYPQIIVLHCVLVQPVTLNTGTIMVATQLLSPVTGYDIPLTNEWLFIPELHINNIVWLNGNPDRNLSVLVIIQDYNTKRVYQHSIQQVEYDFTVPTQPPPNVTLPSVQLYPNPIYSDKVNINFRNTTNPQNIKASLYNIKGQRVKQWNVTNDRQETAIENGLSLPLKETYPSGIYFMRVQWNENGKEQTQVKKMMIIK